MYQPLNKTTPTKGNMGVTATPWTPPVTKNPNSLGGPGTVPQQAQVTATPLMQALTRQSKPVNAGSVPPIPGTKPERDWFKPVNAGAVPMYPDKQGMGQVEAPTINLDPRNQPRMGPRQPGAYNRMFVGAAPRNGEAYGSMNEARASNPAIDWWTMQKQARDNGTWQGYNTGLDEYQQRWGQPSSAYGLLQALNRQRIG